MLCMETSLINVIYNSLASCNTLDWFIFLCLALGYFQVYFAYSLSDQDTS